MAFDEQPIIPIPLRGDLIVRIHGVPHDLTRQEADKLIAVINAFVTPGEKSVPFDVLYTREEAEKMMRGNA